MIDEVIDLAHPGRVSIATTMLLPASLFPDDLFQRALGRGREPGMAVALPATAPRESARWESARWESAR
jgi:hypothetical protein